MEVCYTRVFNFREHFLDEQCEQGNYSSFKQGSFKRGEQKMNSTRTTPPSLNITRAIREQTRRIARLFFRMFATRLVGPNIWFSPNLTVSNFYTAVVLWKEAIIIFRRSNHFVFDSLDANGLVDIVGFYRLDIESGEWPSWHSKCSHHSS